MQDVEVIFPNNCKQQNFYFIPMSMTQNKLRISTRFYLIPEDNKRKLQKEKVNLENLDYKL